MESTARYRALCTFILILVVTYGMWVNNLLHEGNIESSWAIWFLTVLSSGAIFEIAVSLASRAIDSSRLLSRIYWGADNYWSGYWHYTSHTDDRQFLGIWHIHQTVSSSSVHAIGLDESYRRRFTSHSITDIDAEPGASGVFQVVLARDDYAEQEDLVYSRTRLVSGPIQGRWPFFRRVERLSGSTFVYGGRTQGFTITRDVELVRHPEVKSEQELIEKLRRDRVIEGLATIAVAPEAAHPTAGSQPVTSSDGR